MKDFIDWLVSEDSWKGLAAITYLVICIFDFIVVPAWIGVTRPSALDILLQARDLDYALVAETVRILATQHSPFTLQGGGVFHIAFGAVLTGSVLKDKLNSKVEQA